MSADPTALAGAFDKVKAHGLKYSAVSVVNVVVGQGLLFGFVAWAHLGATTANVLAVSISAIPAYYMNRAWVWGLRGKSSLKREVLPFWGFALLGLVISTICVTAASAALGVEKGVDDWRQYVPNIANILSFGTLWVVKFFVLDAIIFGKGHHTADEVEVIEPALVPDAEPDADATGQA